VDIRRQVAKIERSAHQGEYGIWRKTFCRDYREVMVRICRAAAAEQEAYITSLSSSVSCHKGCVYCCSQYVSISIAHGLVITDYLYKHQEFLDHFLRRYEKWLQTLAGTPALVTLEQYTTFSPVVRRTPQALLDDYAKLDVPCPFLLNSSCTIYAVRPICCASHVAISPPEFCMAENADSALICEMVLSSDGLRELALLGDRMLTMHQESLPFLVYRLLTEGFPEVTRKLELLTKEQPQGF